MPDKLAQEQLKIHANLTAKRKAERDTDFQFIAQYALPQESNITTTKTEGVTDWTDRIFDTTLIQAVETLGAGLFNWWTPPNQPWAEYGVPKKLKLKDDDTGVQWLGEASDMIMEEFGRSNFYAVKAMGDIGLAAFATDLIIMDESEGGTELYNFVHCQIGTYTIEEDYKGIVDTARREIKMTYRQVCQKFNKPGDVIPTEMEKQSKGEAGKQKQFTILHCIFPREDSKRLTGRKDGASKPVASVYIALDFKETIRESGYDESPILCRRFKKWATVWGYGPCYLALPDARQVNYVQQYLDASAELHVNPRFITPEAIDGDVDLRPGGETIVPDMETRPQEWGTVSEYKLGLEMQEGRRKAIRDACYNDVFKLLNSQPLIDKKMTAFEISQRLAEQLQNISAVDVRSVMEFINPCMRRAFGIAFRSGRLGQAPHSLMQQVGPGKHGLAMPEIIATSRFNDALRALKNRGVEETFAFVGQIAEQKPELWDNFDMDESVVGYGRNTGMAPDNIRPKKGPNSVEAIRTQRAKIQQAQRAAQMAEQVSKAGKNLGGAPDWMQEQAQDQSQKKQAASK
jgi:hypothetical protein